MSLPVGRVHANHRHTAHSRDSGGTPTSASISRAPISHGATPSPQSGCLRNGARTSVGSLKKPGLADGRWWGGAGGGCKTQFMQMGFHTPSDSVACLCTKAEGGRRCVAMRLTAARSHTPDTAMRTAPRAQNSAALFFLCLPLRPPG